MDNTKEIIDDLRKGKMVIIMDDEDRENEGDLLMAADCITPESINFMAHHGRGLICLTLSQQRCQQLQLPLMVSNNNSEFSTNFTLSIEAATGVTTGISAADRATTVQAAVATDARPQNIVQPGHIFPLMAQEGGVLTRAGHTEAGCDLARLAGYEPAAVIVEILNEDGTMARRPDLEKFAQQHDLKIGTIADLIEYRTRKEQTVSRVTQASLPTDLGEFELFVYEDTINKNQHLAIVKGEIDPDSPMMVRVHIHNPLRDLLGAFPDDNSWPLRSAMECIAEEGQGVVVILRNQINNEQLIDQIQTFDFDRKNQNVINLEHKNAMRILGLGAQIVKDLGITKMRVLGSPVKMPALSGFGLEVVEYLGDEESKFHPDQSNFSATLATNIAAL